MQNVWVQICTLYPHTKLYNLKIMIARFKQSTINLQSDRLKNFCKACKTLARNNSKSLYETILENKIVGMDINDAIPKSGQRNLKPIKSKHTDLKTEHYQCVVGKGNGYMSVYNLPKTKISIYGMGCDAEWSEWKPQLYIYKYDLKGYKTKFTSKQVCLYTNIGIVNIYLASNIINTPSEEFINKYENGEPVILVYGDIEDVTILPILEFLKFDFSVNKVALNMWYATKDLRCVYPKEALNNAIREGGNNGITRKRNHAGLFKLDALLNDYNHGLKIGSKITKTVKELIHSDVKDDTPNVYQETVRFYNDDIEVDYFAPLSPLKDSKNVYKNSIFSGISMKIVDIFGIFSCALDKGQGMVGIIDSAKDLVPKHRKGDMVSFGRENPDDAFVYAMGDARHLHNMLSRRVKQINKIIYNSLGFDPKYGLDDCPRTSGALVSDTTIRWIGNKYPLLLAAIEVMAVPYGEEGRSKFEKYLKLLPAQKELVQKGLFEFKKGKPVDIKSIHKKWGIFGESDGISGMARASIGGFAGRSNNETRFNAIVMGGRCNNEHPFEQVVENAFDPDLSSCYGSTLDRFIFPIGRPTVKNGFYFDESGAKKSLTLGEVIDKYIKHPDGKTKPKFIAGLYQIIVEGSLDFEQDLIYSKPDVTDRTMDRDIHGLTTGGNFSDVLDENGDVVEKNHIKGDFVLLKKEIKNGIITSDEINIIRNVSNKKELKQFRDLKVTTFAYYSTEDRLFDDEESTAEEKFWNIQTDDSLRGKHNVIDETDQTKRLDYRNTKWVGLELSEFIGGFLKNRKRLKGERNKYDKLSDEYKAYDAEQTAVKLFINTLYGCFASPYFPISNAILANNITSKARCGVWMMSKALGIRFNATDGGVFGNDDIRFLKTELKSFRNYKPSMNTFADYNRLNKSKGVRNDKFVEDFEAFYKDVTQNPECNIKEAHEKLDVEILKHVNQFWGVYSLELPFEIELKEDNTCKQVAYTAKSDYVLIDPVKPDLTIKIEDRRVIEAFKYGSDEAEALEGNVINVTFKVRGTKDETRGKNHYLHPRRQFLLYLADLINLPDPHLEITDRIGFSQYKQQLNSYNPSDWSKNHDPFDNLYRIAELRPNANHVTKEVYRDHKIRKDYYSNASSKHKNYKAVVNNDAVFGFMIDALEQIDYGIYNQYLKEGDGKLIQNMEIDRYGKNSKKLTERRFNKPQ